MAAGAVAVAVGPLIGGLFTTYLSWRYVFAGEVLIVIAILVLARRIEDEPPGEAAPDRPRRRRAVGGRPRPRGLRRAALERVGLGRRPSRTRRSCSASRRRCGSSSAALFLLWLFFAWESRLEERGDEPLVRPSMLRNAQMVGGLRMFFFQYFVQSGVFFVVPLFLSVSLGLSAIDTGVRLLPLSITLLIAAAGIPRFRPDANPRRVVRLGAPRHVRRDRRAARRHRRGRLGRDRHAAAAARSGLGIGALASQLGGVTVSAVPDELSPEVGGLQNTATNIGASLGTALAGSVLIASLTATLLTGIEQNPAVPARGQPAGATRSSPAACRSSPTTDLEAALEEAGVAGKTADGDRRRERQGAAHARCEPRWPSSRSSPRAALFFSGPIPTRQPGSQAGATERGPPHPDHAPV